ncbi:MAG: beta strand repeat-containing protein, partial [Limisphaerales bacterium]
MKLTTVFSQILCGITVAITANAQQTLTWDPGSSGGSGGTGTWDFNTTADWYNGTSDVTWLDNSVFGANTAIFGGTAGTVTLNGSLSASNLQFTTAGYTLSGSGTLTLGAGGINGSSLGSGTTTIGVTLALPQAQQPWQIGSGGTLAINGTINRSVGAAVDFSPTGVTTATLTNDATGVIGGWATVGAISSTTTGDWAVTNSGGAITAYTGYTDQSSAGGTSPNLSGVSSQNWFCGDQSGANNWITTLTNSVTIHSLVQMGDVQFNNGVTFTLGDGGLLLRGATSRWLLNVSGSPNSSFLTSGASTGELVVDVPGGSDNNWTIWPIIENNGATPVVLVKNSAGLLKLGNMNTYTGDTIVNAGILCATAGSEYGFGNAPTGIITPFGLGTITMNNAAKLELGINVGNAFGEYDYTNPIIVNSGTILEVDGFQHLKGQVTVGSGGVSLGATYDNKTDGLLNGFAKGIFVDSPVVGNGPITVEDSGIETVNPWDSSTVYFTAPTNTYSGTVTVNTWPNEGGSYLFLTGTDALASATVNVIGDNSAGSGRFGASGLIFGSGTNLDGVGYATIGALSGTGDIGLYDTLVSSSSSGYSVGNPFALTVGNNNASTTYSGALGGGGSLTKVGTGTLTLSGTETYTGNTTVSRGKLALTSAFLDSTNIVIGSGAILDVSALGSVTLAPGQNLLGAGTVNGSVTANSGSEVFADSGVPYGTNVFTGSLTLNSGALVHLSVGTVAPGPNDLITVGGTVTANGNVIHISAPTASASLQAADYTLVTSANPISGAFAAAPSWDVAPVNAGNFSIVTSGNTVTLHYTAATSPSGGGVATPNPAGRNQNVLITVTATNGTGGTVNSVVVNATPIGGSGSLPLV